MSELKMLNVGCGSVFHSQWQNIDLQAASPLVCRYDIRKGLPYPSTYFDVCYTSHLLEHMKKDEAEGLLREMHRVLTPNGIIRVAVPDLENIVRTYLIKLENLEKGEKEEEANYDWMMLELYDQTVRAFPGGEMGRSLTDASVKNKDFILSRIGVEAENFLEKRNSIANNSISQKLKGAKLTSFFKKIRYFLAKNVITFITGKEGKDAFEEGRFRNSGEIHRWMYDRFSLRRLLLTAGFIEAKICHADESQIPGFNDYALDTLNGKPRKPDSLYMEAKKKP